MVHKVLLWSGLGLACRFWQLGIEMRPFFNRQSLWVYPVYGGIGGSFGYWLMGVEQRQMAFLQERRDRLLEKRKRRAEALTAQGIDVESEGLGLRDVESGNETSALLSTGLSEGDDAEGSVEIAGEGEGNGNGNGKTAEA